MSNDDAYSRWVFDERLREQLAYVLHHDLLSICYDLTTGSEEREHDKREAETRTSDGTTSGRQETAGTARRGKGGGEDEGGEARRPQEQRQRRIGGGGKGESDGTEQDGGGGGQALRRRSAERDEKKKDKDDEEEEDEEDEDEDDAAAADDEDEDEDGGPEEKKKVGDTPYDDSFSSVTLPPLVSPRVGSAAVAAVVSAVVPLPSSITSIIIPSSSYSSSSSAAAAAAAVPRPLGDLVDRRLDSRAKALATKFVTLVIKVLDDSEARFEMSEMMLLWEGERRRRDEAKDKRRRDKIEDKRRRKGMGTNAANAAADDDVDVGPAGKDDDHKPQPPQQQQQQHHPHRSKAVFPVPDAPLITRRSVEKILKHHQHDKYVDHSLLRALSMTTAATSATTSPFSPSPQSGFSVPVVVAAAALPAPSSQSRVSLGDLLPSAYRPFVKCLDPHVGGHSDPPESFADVLDKVSLLLKLVPSSLPAAPRPLPHHSSTSNALSLSLSEYYASVPSLSREALRRSRPLLSVHRPRPPTATYHFGADKAARAAATGNVWEAVTLAQEEEARRRDKTAASRTGGGAGAGGEVVVRRPKTAPGLDQSTVASGYRPGSSGPVLVRSSMGLFQRSSEDAANIESPSMGCSALLSASMFGRADVVSSLLSSPAALVNGRCPTTGRTALHLAALGRHFDVAVILVERGASKRMRDLDGMTPTEYGEECKDPESQAAARCLRDAPGRVLGLRAVVSSASDGDVGGGGFSATLDWDDPKGLGYAVDPIDRAMVSVVALAPRAVNTMYYKYLKILNMAPIEVAPPANELGWVSVDTSDKPFKLRGLLPFETYQIRVCAHSFGGYGPNSRVLLHQTSPAVPSRPAGPPMFIASTNSSVTVSWIPPLYENGSPIEKYEISRRLIIAVDKKPAQPPADGGTNITTTTTTTKATTNSPHSFEAAAVSPTTPSSDSRNDGLDDGDVNVPGAQPWVRQISNGPNPTFVATSVPPGARIQIRVKAKNAVGAGAYGPISEPFEAVDPVRMMKKTANSLTIQWQTVPGKQVDFFQLQRRKYGLMLSEDMYETVRDDIAPFPLINGGISHFIGDCSAGTEYQFRIRAKLEESGWQPWVDGVVSSVFKTTEMEPDPPSTPVDKIGASTASSIILEWSPGSSNGKAISAYELWQNHINSPEPRGWELLQIVKGALSLKIAGLDLGGSYYFKVRAKNEIGWGGFSPQSELISTNPIPIPGKPREVGGGIGWIDLEWDVPVAEMLVDSYEVQKRVVEKTDLGALPWEIVTSTITVNRMLIQELGPCKVYQFRIRALTFDGWSSFSDVSEPMTTKRRY